MTARIGQPKTGGRKRGSLDREQRKVLTDKMTADLMYCYAKLGGRSWLLKFAEENPGEFLRQGLSRLFPAPTTQKDEADVQFNQVNIGSLSDLDAATRIAFVLSKGMQEQPTIEAKRLPAEPAAPLDYPTSTEPTDPDRERWASELKLSEEERRDRVIARQEHFNSTEQGLRKRSLL